MSYCILILVAGSALYLEPISKGADLGGFLWAGFCRIDLRAFQMELGYASLKRSSYVQPGLVPRCDGELHERLLNGDDGRWSELAERSLMVGVPTTG